MVYNVWNDPELEIIEATITRFVDDISDEDIEALVNSSHKDYPEDIDEYDGVHTQLLQELKNKYLVDIEIEENVEYFHRKLRERVARQYEAFL